MSVALRDHLEAERSLLGCILLDKEAFYAASESLVAEDFREESHQKLFRAVAYCQEHNLPLDMVALRETLVKQGEKQPDMLIEYTLQLMDSVASPDRAPFYAKVVEEQSQLRKLRRAAQEILNLTSAESLDPQQILAEAERKIYEIAQTKKLPVARIETVAKEVFHFFKQREGKQGLLGIASGFVDLDRLTAGFQPSDLIIIAGRTSMGKTSFAMNIAENVTIKQQIPVVIFSLEMSKEQLAMRLLCSLSRVSSADLRRGKIDQDAWSRLTHAVDDLSDAPLFIDDTPAITPLQLKSKVMRLKREQEIGLIIVDYLQLMSPNRRYDNRPLEIAEISRSLKEIARDLNIPVLALSQLSRQADKEEKPKLSHLRESGSIEQDADLVIFIHRKELKKEEATELTQPFEENSDVEIIIAKHRNGPTGTVQMVFNQAHTLFMEKEKYLNE